VRDQRFCNHITVREAKFFCLTSRKPEKIGMEPVLLFTKKQHRNVRYKVTINFSETKLFVLENFLLCFTKFLFPAIPNIKSNS
jgi:hypothetical protein